MRRKQSRWKEWKAGVSLSWLMFRVKIYLFFKCDLPTWFHCKWGYHKTWRAFESWKSGSKEEVKVNFNKCKTCQIMIFDTPEDKERYLKEKNRFDSTIFKWVRKQIDDITEVKKNAKANNNGSKEDK